MSKKKIAIIVFAILVIIGVVVFFLFRGRISATTMRILRLEGNVSLQDEGGMKTVKENLRLTSGNVLDTSTESLVSIGLDEVKIVTLDELSRAEFNQSGKKLNLDLTKGSLFFEVDKPLADDETFEIETSTMIVGIRGTSGWVSVEGENESLIITDGHVHVIGTNPVTGEVKEVEVSAGQRLIVYLYNDREVDSIMFELEDVTEHELSKFVINILRSKSSLLDKVIAATGWDRDYILGISDAEPDDQSTTQVADNDPNPEPEPEPEPEPAPEPVVPDVDGNDGPEPAQANNNNQNNNNQNNNHNNNNNVNGGGNNADTTADTLTTVPVTKTELEKQIDAAKAQVVSENTDGTYTLADNTVFDPAYYGQAYPDVVAQYGDTSEALLAHYVAVGQSEGRYASKDEQDAAKLAEDIARLEAQRIADEAAAAQAASNTNNNQQNQNQQQQQQNNNPSRVTGGNIEFAGGAKGTYNAGQITLTDPDSAQTYTATLPATYADENGVDQNVSLANISVDTSSNIGTVDASAINATPSQIAQWLHSTNSGTATRVTDSPTTYEAIMGQGAGTPDIVASVSLNNANTISSVNSIIPLLNSDIDRVRLDGTYVAVEYSTTAPDPSYPYILEWGQTNAEYVQYDSAASNSNVAAFHDANGNDYYIHADGTVNNTP